MSSMISRLAMPIALTVFLAAVSVNAQSSTARAGSAASAPRGPGAPVPGDGLAIINRSCVGCHESGQILQTRHREDWPPIIERMRTNGANISDGDAKVVLDYVIKNYTTPN